MTRTDEQAIAHALENTNRHVALSGPSGWAYWTGKEWVGVRRQGKEIIEIGRTADVERVLHWIDPQDCELDELRPLGAANSDGTCNT